MDIWRNSFLSSKIQFLIKKSNQNAIKTNFYIIFKICNFLRIQKKSQKGGDIFLDCADKHFKAHSKLNYNSR